MGNFVGDDEVRGTHCGERGPTLISRADRAIMKPMAVTTQHAAPARKFRRSCATSSARQVKGRNVPHSCQSGISLPTLGRILNRMHGHRMSMSAIQREAASHGQRLGVRNC